MPVGLIVVFKHSFKACLLAYIPGLGPSERGFTAEGPEEGTGVGIGTPAGCSGADGLVVKNKFGGDVGTFVGDAVGPGIVYWGEKRPPGGIRIISCQGLQRVSRATIYTYFHVR